MSGQPTEGGWLEAAERAVDLHPVSGPRVALILIRREVEEAAERALAHRAVDPGQSQLAARFLCWELCASDRAAARGLYETWSRCSSQLHQAGDVFAVGAESVRREIAAVRHLLARATTRDATPEA